ILRGLAVVALSALGVVLGAVILRGTADLHLGKTVDVVELRGVITDSTQLVETLDTCRTRPSTLGVVLRIDSPGGAVAPSQEIYDAVWRLRAEKPVVA